MLRKTDARAENGAVVSDTALILRVAERKLGREARAGVGRSVSCRFLGALFLNGEQPRAERRGQFSGYGRVLPEVLFGGLASLRE